MDATSALIAVAGGAWVLQIATGYYQVRAFNRMLQTISSKGVVKIGKTSSRWKPRTIVVLAHDQNGVVVDAKLMQGISVFSRPKTFTDLIHQRIPLDEQWLNARAASEKEALICALSTK